MPKCTVCHHPRRQAIDLALLTGDATYEALSGQYGPSISSLFRHKKHLEEKMIQTRQRLKNSQEQGCLLKLNAFLDHVQGAVRTAEADGNVDKVLKGSHVGSRIIHQINQMEVPLELDTVYRLISSPQWTSQDSLLPTDPRIITGIHQALADHAFSLCPDPEPEIIPEATHSSLLETQNLELETPEPGPEFPPDLRQMPGTKKLPPPTWPSLPVSKRQTRHPKPCPKPPPGYYFGTAAANPLADWTNRHHPNQTNRKPSEKPARNYREITAKIGFPET